LRRVSYTPWGAALERNHVPTKAEARWVTYVTEQATAPYIEVEVRERHGMAAATIPPPVRVVHRLYDMRNHAVQKENDASDGYDRLR